METMTPDRCPVTAALTVIGGKWKPVILFQLRDGALRFGALRRVVPGVTQKMLTQQLRELERDGIVCRLVHHQVPPKVEYGLTEWGQELCPALDALLTWAEARVTL